MIRIFTQPITLTNANTIQRDADTLEAAVNAFIKQPNVEPKDLEFFTYASGAVQYYVVTLDYNLTKTS